jgi:hypothetical protein
MQFALTIVRHVDREAIARGQRRRQAEEALEVERDRTAMLEAEIEDLVTQLEGARVDEQTFAAMTPDDVETVKAILDPSVDFEVEEDETQEYDTEAEAEDDPAAEIESEIQRLEEEIADSRRNQVALERYLEALDRK